MGEKMSGLNVRLLGEAAVKALRLVVAVQKSGQLIGVDTREIETMEAEFREAVEVWEGIKELMDDEGGWMMVGGEESE